ncbi:MAG: hypothetical protein H7Z43_00855 [Clostridia bacterium]|nr:hypothetical protein [Deltaproteobacteria bacterium]
MKTIAFGLLVASGLACTDTPAQRFENQQKNMPLPDYDGVKTQPTVDLTRNEAADVMVMSVRAFIDKKEGATVVKVLTDVGRAIDGLQHPASASSKEAMHASISRLQEAEAAQNMGTLRDALHADLNALKDAEVPLANGLIKAAEREVDTLDRGKSVAEQELVLWHATCSVASAVAVASALNAFDCATVQ